MLTIYSKNNCGYCVQAKAFLKNKDIPFEEVNIEEDTDQMQFILSEGHRTMPQIITMANYLLKVVIKDLEN